MYLQCVESNVGSTWGFQGAYNGMGASRKELVIYIYIYIYVVCIYTYMHALIHLYINTYIYNILTPVSNQQMDNAGL